MTYISASKLDSIKTLKTEKKTKRELKVESKDKSGQYRLWLLADKINIEIERKEKKNWVVVETYNGTVAKKSIGRNK